MYGLTAHTGTVMCGEGSRWKSIPAAIPLIIEDYVYLEGFSNLTIHGTGSSGDALLRVAPGEALIWLTAPSMQMRGGGIYTIWQEDGSTLYIDQSEFTKVDGPIHYSRRHEGTLYEDAVMGYVALPENSGD